MKLSYWFNFGFMFFNILMAIFWWSVPLSHWAMGWFAFYCWAAVFHFDEMINKLAKEDL